MAPEYAMEGLFSVKSDVFSFGVIMLEIISGKRNSGFYITELAPTLLAYVTSLTEHVILQYYSKTSLFINDYVCLNYGRLGGCGMKERD